MNVLIRGGAVVTCDAKHQVLAGDVAVRGREIVAIGPDAASRLPPPFRVIDARGCVVMPGLVQTHVHLVQVLFRGIAEDLPLLDWLKQRIWPLEGAHDDESLRVSAELGLVEMLRAGTTSILDMGTVHGHDVVMDACVRSGIRAISGKAMMDAGVGVPKTLREKAKASLRESERLAKAWQGKADGRVGYAFCPRFILSCSEGLLRDTASAAKELGAFVHTHASEHAAERKAVIDAVGASDVLALRSWGIHGAKTVLAHCVQITSGEMKTMAKDGTRVAHCPSANMKLGSGLARVEAMRKAGIVVGLGADGAPCNNSLSPWLEMRHAGLVAKASGDATALPARDIVRMATIDGAKVLGLDGVTGSLEVGKRADIAVVRIDGAHAAPAIDLMATLVYACQATDVEHVLIDGAEVVRAGRVMTLDAEKIAGEARAEAVRVAKAAKVL